MVKIHRKNVLKELKDIRKILIKVSNNLLPSFYIVMHTVIRVRPQPLTPFLNIPKEKKNFGHIRGFVVINLFSSKAGGFIPLIFPNIPTYLASKFYIMEGFHHCPPNFAPLSPVPFLKRASTLYGCRPSLLYGSRVFTWSQTYGRCLSIASALVHHFHLSPADLVLFFHSFNSSDHHHFSSHKLHLYTSFFFFRFFHNY